MHPSTEKMLRDKLSLDLAETDFAFGVVKFMAVFSILLLIAAFLEPLSEGRSPFKPAPQAQQHKHPPHKRSQ